MTAQGGLGRGLGSLIPPKPPLAPSADATEPNSEDSLTHAVGAAEAGATDPVSTQQSTSTDTGSAYFAVLPVGAVQPNSRQPRQVFDEESMAELVHSIAEVGLLQPVVVRPLSDDRYELIMGERRWRAVQAAGLTTLPAIVRDTADHDLLRDALLENLHRAQLNPLEEAAAFQQMLDDFDCTHDELAQRIGRSRPQISNTLRLLNLSVPVQRRVAAGVLSAGHARTLLGVANVEAQDRLASRVIAEGLSVRSLEELVAAGVETPRQPIRRTRMSAPGLEEIADRLSERFETRCRVELGARKGKITVEFASLEDLRRILALLDPSESTSASGAARAD